MGCTCCGTLTEAGVKVGEINLGRVDINVEETKLGETKGEGAAGVDPISDDPKVGDATGDVTGEKNGEPYGELDGDSPERVKEEPEDENSKGAVESTTSGNSSSGC